MGSHCFLCSKRLRVAFNKLLDSGDQAWPALGVALAILGHWSQTAMSDFYLRASGHSRQLPAYNRPRQGIGVPAREPGIFQHARRIEFENLTVMDEIGVSVLPGSFKLSCDKR